MLLVGPKGPTKCPEDKRKIRLDNSGVKTADFSGVVFR